MTDRVKYPPGAAERIEAMLHERDRIERRHMRQSAVAAVAFVAAVRALFDRHGGSPWTMQIHARTIREFRILGRQYGATVSARARAAAHDMAALSAEHQGRALGIFATAALGQRVPPVAVDLAAAMAVAAEVIDARTEDVGAPMGEDMARVAASTSFANARIAAAVPAVLVGLSVAKALRPRALDRAERVIVTEMTAGAAEGGDAARVQLVKRFPKLPKLRRVWDSTLDKRVCRICAGLHHVVVDADKPFPGGFFDEPAHARCRCATMPWLDEWTAMLDDDLQIAPGPRVGVQETAETRLKTFGERAPGFGEDAQIVTGTYR